MNKFEQYKKRDQSAPKVSKSNNIGRGEATSSSTDKWDKYKKKSLNLSPNTGKNYEAQSKTLLSGFSKPKTTLSSYKQSIPEIVGKSAVSGALSLLDLPQIVGMGGEWAKNSFNRYRAGKNNTTSEDTNYFGSLPFASTKIKDLVRDNIGVDLEPRPENEWERIISNISSFASPSAGVGAVGKAAKGARLANAVKHGKTGAGIGGISGVLQEGGVNPLVSDIGTSLLYPFAVGSGRNLINKFSSGHKENIIGSKVSKALKDQVGEKNLPQVLENIENYKNTSRLNPIDLKPTTAEIAQDPGLSRLVRTQSNSQGLSQANIDNNKIVTEALRDIGETGLLPSVRGEAIRRPFVESHQANLNKRFDATNPLYEELETITQAIDPIQGKALLNKYIDVAGPDNKGVFNTYLNHLENPATPTKIDNTLRDLADRIDMAYRSGSKEAALKYGKIKKALEGDLEGVPLARQARNEYNAYSQPINQRTRSPLLHAFVKKQENINKTPGLVVPPEKIPKYILNAGLDDTKLLMNEVKGNKDLLDLVKGTYTDHILDKVILPSGEFSYHQARKILDNKYTKEKIDLIYNTKEKKELNQILDFLKKRYTSENLGRSKGSDSHQKFTVQEDIRNSLTSSAEKFVESIPFVGGLSSRALKAGKDAEKARYGNILENALVNPDVFSELIKNPRKVQGFSDFYNPNIGPLGATILANRRER